MIPCKKGKWIREVSDFLTLIHAVEGPGGSRVGRKEGVRMVGKFKIKDWEQAM
jgi:hypothetical protein